MDRDEQYRGCNRSGGRSEWARLPLDLSLRAKRSTATSTRGGNLQGAVTIKSGDCFVTLFLAMTPPERLRKNDIRPEKLKCLDWYISTIDIGLFVR